MTQGPSLLEAPGAGSDRLNGPVEQVVLERGQGVGGEASQVIGGAKLRRPGNPKICRRKDLRVDPDPDISLCVYTSPLAYAQAR